MIDPEDPGTVDIEQLTTPGQLKSKSIPSNRIWRDEDDGFPDDKPCPTHTEVST